MGWSGNVVVVGKGEVGLGRVRYSGVRCAGVWEDWDGCGVV